MLNYIAKEGRIREEIIRMSKRELRRLEVINKVIGEEIRQKEAAEILSLSTRQVKRIVKRVKIHGAVGMVHGNRGEESKRKFPLEFRERVLEIVEEKYYDLVQNLPHTKIIRYFKQRFSNLLDRSNFQSILF